MGFGRFGRILGSTAIKKGQIEHEKPYIYYKKRLPSQGHFCEFPLFRCRKTAQNSRKAGLHADLVTEWPYNGQKKPAWAQNQPNRVNFGAGPARQIRCCSPVRGSKVPIPAIYRPVTSLAGLRGGVRTDIWVQRPYPGLFRAHMSPVALSEPRPNSFVR